MIILKYDGLQVQSSSIIHAFDVSCLIALISSQSSVFLLSYIHGRHEDSYVTFQLNLSHARLRHIFNLSAIFSLEGFTTILSNGNSRSINHNKLSQLILNFVEWRNPFSLLISYHMNVWLETKPMWLLVSPSGRFATLNDKHSWIFEYVDVD